MPPVFHSIELDERTGKAYDDLAREMVARILEGEKEHLLEASIPLVLALRLSQITGGYSKSAEGEVVELGGEKLAVLGDIIEEYGLATVADLYDLCGITTEYTDENWGWTSARYMSVIRSRRGYMLQLPKPDHINAR